MFLSKVVRDRDLGVRKKGTQSTVRWLGAGSSEELAKGEKSWQKWDIVDLHPECVV